MHRLRELLISSLALLFLLGLPRLSHAAEPLVDIAWVKANLGKPGIVFLDVTSGGGRSKNDFAQAHLPGAVFTDYGKDGWRVKTKEGVAGMMGPVDKLETLIGSLGIDNKTHVVLVPMGQSAQEMGTATRIYWTFKVLGHDEVSILDGGLLAWVSERDKATKKPLNPLEQGLKPVTAKTFKANLRPQYLATRDDVKKAMSEQTPLVDNRPVDFFMGVTKSGAATKGGTLPGAKNLPEGWLTDNNSGKFRKKEQLTKLYSAAGVPTSGKQITFCNTGHWASLGWFVSSEIMGNKETKMYDGSMADWTHDKSGLPVDQKIKLN